MIGVNPDELSVRRVLWSDGLPRGFAANRPARESGACSAGPRQAGNQAFAEDVFGLGQAVDQALRGRRDRR